MGELPPGAIAEQIAEAMQVLEKRRKRIQVLLQRRAEIEEDPLEAIAQRYFAADHMHPQDNPQAILKQYGLEEPDSGLPQHRETEPPEIEE